MNSRHPFGSGDMRLVVFRSKLVAAEFRRLHGGRVFVPDVDDKDQDAVWFSPSMTMMMCMLHPATHGRTGRIE